MSKPHPLAGLIANYGDSDDDSDDGAVYTYYSAADKQTNKITVVPGREVTASNVPGIQPPPIAHCPWSACYDESSGFTYYWNQKTNAVTWEAPPEYLLALKIAQQHLHCSGSTEVSAEEWQLYQQALAEKQNTQNKLHAKAAISKSSRPDRPHDSKSSKERKSRGSKKRPASEEDEKIELITSYHNSDSESNEELESPAKAPPPTIPKAPKIQKVANKKPKKVQMYGPTNAPNKTNYSVPIGPELPPNIQTRKVSPTKEPNPEPVQEIEIKKPASSNECDDSQDEGTLLKRLKDQAKLLEKLGGELPTELQQMIKEDNSTAPSPKSDEGATKSVDIDDLLQEIEKKEFGKGKKNENSRSNLSSAINSPKSDGNRTPPLDDLKVLFPSAKNVEPVPQPPSDDIKPSSPQKPEKKENIYLINSTEPVENTNRKRLRISNSVLPERKTDTPVYTTRYANEGSEKTGLGFSKDDDFRSGIEEEEESPKDTVSYGNGLTFTKGGTLNGESEPVKPAEQSETEAEDEPQVLETRLSQLCEMQPAVVPQLHKMLIQLKTLLAAQQSGALGAEYVASWARASAAALAPLEAHAAAPPPGWSCAFHRCLGRYRYRRESDGLQQYERPALDNTDMDISTTPPHPGHETKEESPKSPAAPAESPPSPPPPPKWPEPPPPGCDDPPPLPPEPVVKEIGDELMSFYNDIAELEKGTTAEPQEAPRQSDKEAKPPKKKSKVKISTSMGLKHKSVSNLVAKWQQVAEEINSD